MGGAGAVDAAGRRVLTFVARNPPGQPATATCRWAAELKPTPTGGDQLLPSSLAPGLRRRRVLRPAEIAADGRDHNGQASFQRVADVLEIEGVPARTRWACSTTTRCAKTSSPCATRSSPEAGDWRTLADPERPAVRPANAATTRCDWRARCWRRAQARCACS